MDDNNNHTDQFNASLQLPDEGRAPKKPSPKHDDSNPAADLIRKKIEAAYRHEPDAEAEIKEVKSLGKGASRSRHQQFMYELTNSGRPLHEINTAWHEYYAALSDAEKHDVWQEFYDVHSQTARHPAVSQTTPAPSLTGSIAKKVPSRVIKHTTKHPAKPKKPAAAKRRRAAKPAKPANPFHSLLFGLGIGSITILIFLFGFFNERIIAPFIQPSRNTANIPVIATPDVNVAASSEPEIIIPKINVEAPVVYGVSSTDDSVVQKALETGVVHYADTALPGQNGNDVIVGHSSGNIFAPGQYKYVFSLLHKLDEHDVFYLQKDSVRYTYQIYKKEIVKPTDVWVLGPRDQPATVTLITCDPPGVSSNRLVVVAKQISPDPANNIKTAAANTAATTKTTLIPSDSQTMWSRLVHWFTQ